MTFPCVGENVEQINYSYTAKGTIHDTATREQLFSMICKVEHKCTLWGNSTLVYSQNKGVMGAPKNTRETVIAELFLKAENWKQL